MLITGVIIFVLAYALIASEKVDKTIVALLGAAAMLICRVASFEKMAGNVDLNVLALLVGMMVIVNLMATTGAFEYLAVFIARKSRGNGYVVTALFLLVTAFISAFMDNVTTVILMAPVTILICQLLALPAAPILILIAIFSNIGGTATLIGDPPNILIGASAKLSFNDFILNLTPVIVTIAAVTLVIALLILGKRLKTTDASRSQVELTEPARAILDHSRLKRSLIVFGVILLGFFTSTLTGIDSGVIALTGALAMVLVCRVELPTLLEKVEWGTILFFCGLFMMIGALEANGLFTWLGEEMVAMTAGDFAMTLMVILWGSAILSAVVDNIPLVIAMIPLINSIVPTMAEKMGVTGAEAIAAQVAHPLFWALALGACLGGNGTLIGASANVVISQVARKNRCPFTFWEFTKYGFPLMLLSTAISSVYLYFRYIH